jgi:hypothetical protein
MLKISIPQFNTNYISFECPKCGYEELLMNHFACNNCSVILPDIEKIPTTIEERVEIYRDSMMEGVWV